MWGLRQVEKLEMRGMNLKELSPYIGLFGSLRYLDLEGNGLTSLPSTLQLCRNLEELLICSNNFESLPGFLVHMPKLRRLSRHSNLLHNTYNNCPQALFPNKNTCAEVDTLLSLSSIGVAKNIHFIASKDIDLVEIPRTLRPKVYETFKDVSYCNFCQRGIFTQREEGECHSLYPGDFPREGADATLHHLLYLHIHK